jgi:hypothetical protein
VADGLRGELSAAPPGVRRIAWVTGGLRFVLKESAVRIVGYALGLAVAVEVVVTVDRIGTSGDSSQVSLLVLLVGAAALGFVAPRWAWLAGLVLGSAVAVSGMADAAWGPPPSHPTNPAGVGGAPTLFVLVVPGLLFVTVCLRLLGGRPELLAAQVLGAAGGTFSSTRPARRRGLL